MSITATIRAALIADLQAIDGTGIFVTTLATVAGEPFRINEVSKPAICVRSDESGEEPETITVRRDEVVQIFTLDCFLSSATPYADMDALIDDIRNAIERSASNLFAISTVLDTGVASWGPLGLDPNNLMDCGREVLVAVKYIYTRGAA